MSISGAETKIKLLPGLSYDVCYNDQVQSSFYILYGQDDFSCHQALDEIKNSLGDAEMLAVNTSLLDGQQLSLRELREVCSAAPFLSPVRLVIVQDLLKCFETKKKTGRQVSSRAESSSKSKIAEWRALGDYVKEQMPPTTVLILVDSKLENKNPLLKSLSPLARVRAFSQLRGKDLRNWIQGRISHKGGTISYGAIDLLIEFIGGDLWAMVNEIDKLLAHSSGQSITEDDVKLVTSYVREASIFALVDAVLEGRVKIAQRLLHQLLQEGVTPAYILTMIARQLRLIVRAKDSSNKSPSSQIQNGLNVTSNYSLDKALKQAKAYNMSQIKQAYNKLLETDIAVKTGKYDDDLALDLLVVELCRN